MKTKILIFIGVLLIIAVLVIVLNKNNQQKSEITEPSQLTPTELCYHYNQVATKDAPYSADEYISLETIGNKITGSKQGTQNGPDMSNGYQGSLKGTIEDGQITVVFDYEIEGSKNKEQELYIKTDSGLSKKRYPLIEKNKILVPDTTKEFKYLEYKLITCPVTD